MRRTLLALLLLAAVFLSAGPAQATDFNYKVGVQGPGLPGLDCVSVGLDPLSANPHPDCVGGGQQDSGDGAAPQSPPPQDGSGSSDP
jgi:hypothetical protein